MKNRFLKMALQAAFFLPVINYAQQGVIQPCDTYYEQEQYFKSNPQEKVKFEKAQTQLQKEYEVFVKNKANNKSAAVQFTVPVVFHVLHLGGSENVSDAQIIAALQQVNSDYARQGADTASIFAPFKALYVNSDIKFMLAKKDPNGNCTNGIVHTYDARTIWDRNPPSSGSNPALFQGITWNTTKYLNVIIVKDIVSAPGQTGQVIGYTFLPGTFNAGAIQDAIVYNGAFLGGLDARSLSHEIGHWFNLIHTFGNTNNPGIVCGSTAGGDQVSDTPDTKGNFSTCPNSSTNTAFTCTSPNPANSSNYYQNVQNIMDYSSCPKNFTQGQTSRMQTALQSITAGRSNLITPANLSFTDVNGIGSCIPIADFYPSSNAFTVCAGGSLNMRDFTYNATVSSYQWAADNGAIIASPNSSITMINFPTAGVCNVSLTATGTQGSNTKVKTVTVINSSPGITGSILEGFEGAGLPADWSIINGNGGSITWVQTNTAAYEGIYSYYINGISSGVNNQDALVTPIMDLANSPGAAMTFQYAYCRQTPTHNDELKIQGSKDCGGTWQDIFTMNASYMANGSGGTGTAPFFPTPEQWKMYDISAHPNWNSYTSSSSVMIRFNFVEAGYGNNIFIDAINITLPVGINELTKSIKLNMYPNPSDGETTLAFHLNEGASVKVNVLDILGHVVQPLIDGNYGAGEQQITINKDHSLSKGIYFVELSLNGAKMTKKLVIQ